MLDLVQLLPNSKKDAKLDTKSQRHVINEVADMKVTILSTF
jgi:ribosome biogenesis protein BRX1